MRRPPAPEPATPPGPLSGTSWVAEGPEDTSPFDAGEAERYRAGAEIGRGGMGQVIAVHDRRLDRTVAQKSLLRPGPDAEARLEREARVTASLEHPGVVPIYDAGRDAQGRLCYRMRRVQGRSLAEAIRAAPPGESRLRLLRPLLDACRAVAYAHARGVVHRDLKPENLLVGEFGEALVTDWGLAAELFADSGERLTGQGVALGTPGFMSPEQRAGDAPARTDDVWALGQVLRELIGPEGPPELHAVAAQAQAPLGQRYPDAAALADELEAWFEGRRVRAYAYRPAELLRRGLDRWRLAVRIGSLALVFALAVAVWAAARVDAARDRAVAAEGVAVAALARADANLAVALVRQARDAAIAGDRPEAETLAAHALALAADPEARGVLAMFAHVARPRGVAQRAQPVGCVALDLAPDGAHQICQSEDAVQLVDNRDGAVRWRKPLRAVSARFVPAGQVAIVDTNGKLSLIDPDGAVRLHAQIDEDLPQVQVDAASGWLMARNERHQVLIRVDGSEKGPLTDAPAPVRADGMLADGRVLRLVGLGELQLGPLVGAPTWRRDLRAELGDLGSVRLVASDAAATLFALATWDGELIVVDRAGTRPPRRIALGIGPVASLAVSPGGTRVAVVGQRGRARVYDPVADTLLPSLPAGGDQFVTFVDEDTLVTVGAAIRRWALPAHSAPTQLDAGSAVTSARFDPAGGAVAAVGSYGRVQVWSTDDGGRRFRVDLARDDVFKDVAFVSNGAEVVVPSLRADQPTRLDAHTGAPVGPPRPADLQRRVAPFGDGGLLGFGWTVGPVRLDLRTGVVDTSWRLVHALPLDLGATPEGDVAALLLRNGDVVLLSAAGGPSATTTALYDAAAVAVDVGRAGEVLAVGTPDRVRLVVRGEERWLALGEGADLVDLAISPAGDRLAAGLRDGRALVFDVDSGALLAVLNGHRERVASVDWSPDGALLATGSWDDTVRLWGLAGLTAAPADVLSQTFATWGLDLDAALHSQR